MRTRLAALARDDALLARLARIAIWVAAVTLAILVLDLLGIPVSEWIRELFRKIREVPAWAVVGGVVLQSTQTSLAALAWLTILRAAYPRAEITFRLVLAAYAVSVAMNSFLPANIGTWVMLIMFTSVIAGATFTAMLSGIAVQKIPFSVFNIAVYLYLFLSVAGSFSIKLSGLADHWVLAFLIAASAVVLCVLATRVFRSSGRSSASSCWSVGPSWVTRARRSRGSSCQSSAATLRVSRSSRSSSGLTASRSLSTTSLR